MSISSAAAKGTFLEKHFGHFPLTLVAEHGFYFKPPGQTWRMLGKEVDMEWKKNILEIFKLYSSSTPGSSVEIKNSSFGVALSQKRSGIWPLESR